ncbi:S26 family signal peptidase [Paenibacillus whitsoniae]|uniref:Peptidase S26 domain-containing protein n=1 Tax=Paenibacillus whitsoniae TaxID=2496558 RepID=A0A3S0A5W7_9BACL|nr:S26 family signal peptidase [Paenibacillus whitsoniae]RTE10348.1 hypothetical protein EJQ19_07565 [Paenibacillus whitsoniae]
MKRVWISCLLLVVLAACSEKMITDKSTGKSIEEVSQGSNIIVNPLSDAMDQGNSEYARNVVVDVLYYKTKSVVRGDIVYYGDNNVARVIALPNEKVKVTNGHIYINSRKLDTFYGAAHVRGYDYLRFKDSDMDEPAKQSLIDEIFKKNQSEITLKNDEVLVIGDDWSRSTFSKLLTNEILGKVIGVCTKCSQ